MAADPRKRQKKLQRRAGKRQEKKRAIVKAQNAGLGDKLAKAARFPILHAFVTEPLWSHGMGSLLVSRQLPGGRVAFGSFLIDRYCLGVKDAFGDIFSDDAYAEIMVLKTRDHYAIVELTPEIGRAHV